MANVRQNIILPSSAVGIVVRPCASGSSKHVAGPCRSPNNALVDNPQVLVFFYQCIHELRLKPKSASGSRQNTVDGDRKPQPKYVLSEAPLELRGTINWATCPVYEPITNSVFFVDTIDTSIKRLDADNVVHTVVYTQTRKGALRDAAGGLTGFSSISALVADGKGHIFIADGNCPITTCIRFLKVGSGEVVSLQGTAPEVGYWRSLAYDAAAEVLIAATQTAVCYLPLCHSRTSSTYSKGTRVNSPKLVAGSWKDFGNTDGTGTAARFGSIAAMAARGERRLFMTDSAFHALRVMDSSTSVETVMRVRSPDGMMAPLPGQAAFLPDGTLALCCGNATTHTIAIMNVEMESTANSSTVAGRQGERPALATAATYTAAATTPAARPDLLSFLRVSTNNPTAGALVTVRASGGDTYHVHRTVLMAHSKYLRLQLYLDGGFTDSVTGCVSLEGENPVALGCLIQYMYTGDLCVPKPLLRSVMELARRLLMSTQCMSRLKSLLLAAVTPASVVSDLVWAERHGFQELVPPLKEFLLHNGREVAQQAALEGQRSLKELMAVRRSLAADLLQHALLRQK